MEDDIKSILGGRHVSVDHTLDHHSDEILKVLPVVKRNLCYICCTLLFDDEDRILLVQEAKKSCYGQWYLPAGRLEPGETLVDGAKREVKEESGLECDLTTLLSVELNGMWMRFTFMGKITGGSLKTLDEKDSESLQAQFFRVEDLPQPIRATKWRSDGNMSTKEGGTCVLRSNDIITLITLGKKYKEEVNYVLLPVTFPHKYISYRFVIMDRSTASGSMHILMATKKGKSHIPFRLGNVHKNVHVFALVASVFNEAFSYGLSQCSFQILGVLSIEHRGTGQGEDGVCITLLVSLNLPEESELPTPTSVEYTWCRVTDSNIQTKLHEGCQKKIVPIL